MQMRDRMRVFHRVRRAYDAHRPRWGSQTDWMRPLAPAGGLAIAVLLAALCFPGSACGQGFAPRGLFGNERADEPPEISHLRRLPRDPLNYTSFTNGLQSINDGDLAAGIETLQTILDHSSDFFLFQGLQISGSLVEKIHAVLAKHHEDYERIYGTEASALLDDALTGGDPELLRILIRRFGQTSAGAQGFHRLSRHFLDQGDFASAARLVERMALHPALSSQRAPHLVTAAKWYARAGQGERAQSLLNSHRQLIDSYAATPDGLEVHDGVESLVQRESAHVDGWERARIQLDWRTPFGSANHAGRADFAPILLDNAWSAELIDEFDFSLSLPEPNLRHLLKEARMRSAASEKRMRSESDRVSMPAAIPLVSGGLVMTLGNGTVKALDLKTGELRWVTSFIEPAFHRLNEVEYSPAEPHDSARSELRDFFFDLRNWRDQTMASLSTDGERLYFLADCQLTGVLSPQQLMMGVPRHDLIPQRRNLLHACDLSQEGKILWQLGHSASRIAFGEELSREIFFLGAPLPIGGRLYVLGDERGQVQLFEIDADTGAILWSIGLLNPDRDIILNPDRRLAGMMPASYGGLLYCPTGEGVLTAVDPLERKVVWSHQYHEETETGRQRFIALQRRPQSRSLREAIDSLMDDARWFDSRVLVAGETLVFTPPDSPDLVCLNAATGEEIWKLPDATSQSMYVGGSFSDQLILVRRHDIQALNLADGTPAWAEAIPIPAPSGRGIPMGMHFLQPLVTGEIAVVDLQQPRLLCRIPHPSGRVTGNLAAGDGIVVTQTGTKLFGFHHRDFVQEVLEDRFEKSATDPEGLALRGELHLQLGETESGIADLRASLAVRHDVRARKLLAETLLEGLRTNFVDYASYADELEDLLDTEEQRKRFAMIRSKGLFDSGRIEEALAGYLQLLSVLSVSDLRDVDSGWTVSDERWILGRIDTLFGTANSDEARAALQAQVESWLETVTDDDLAVRFLQAASPDWVRIASITRRLDSMELDESRVLQLELILDSLRGRESPAAQQFAWSKLIQIYLDRQAGQAAHDSLQALSRIASDEEVRPGVTAIEFVSNVRTNREHQDLLDSAPEWPSEIQVRESSAQLTPAEKFPLQVLGPVDSVRHGFAFALDQMAANVIISDSHGRRQFRVPTGITTARTPLGQLWGRYVSFRGHLALVVLADRFLLIDGLTDASEPRVIVRQSLVHDSDNPYESRRGSFFLTNQRPLPGFRAPVAMAPSGRPAGNVGPLNRSSLCYTVGSQLVAIDPTTGQELWRRRDIPAGSEILADDEYVIVAFKRPDPGLLVYRASDGEFVGERAFPSATLPNCLVRRFADWGRFLPRMVARDGQLIWALGDPAKQVFRWQRSFPERTLWAPVNGRDLAFLTPANELEFVDGLTGQTRFSLEMPIAFPAQYLSVHTYDDQWLLFPCRNTPQTGIGVAPAHTQRLDGAVVAISRETQNVIWSRTFEQLSFSFEHAPRWPIVALANLGGSQVDALVLNRRTGETLVDDSWRNDASGDHSVVETQPYRIKLRLATKTLEFHCTDSPTRPLPPSSPPSSPKTSQPVERAPDQSEDPPEAP